MLCNHVKYIIVVPFPQWYLWTHLYFSALLFFKSYFKLFLPLHTQQDDDDSHVKEKKLFWTAFSFINTTKAIKRENVNKIYCNLIVALLCYHQMQLRWKRSGMLANEEKSWFNGKRDKQKIIEWRGKSCSGYWRQIRKSRATKVSIKW